MNSRERMFNMLYGKKTDCVPAAPHWWGLYKFQLAGIVSGYGDEDKGWKMTGSALAEVDSLFYETYKPDWFHLNCADSGIQRDAHTEKVRNEAITRLRELDSMQAVDEFIKLEFPEADEIRKTPMYDHVRILSGKYGEDVFIAVNEGNPICRILDPHGHIGFEEGLIALVENKKMMEYLIFCEYDRMLERIKILKEYGCHGYIGSETYCSSDLISPELYRDIIFPAQKHFYEGTREIGLVPMVYFLGDVVPLLDDVNKLGVAALLVEESKKTFNLDAVKIRKKLSADITLFGNLDSVYTLLNGTVAEVASETERQLECARYGSFAMANGCPIAFNTPKENIEAMIRNWQ